MPEVDDLLDAERNRRRPAAGRARIALIITGAVTVVAYAGPYWNYCCIEFQHGTATRVRFWGK